MTRKAHIVAFSDGSLMEVSERDIWRKSSDFSKRFDPRQFMRVGLFSVAIGRLDLAISAPDEYRQPMETVPNTSEYWGRSCKDRLSQLKTVETALTQFPGHPFEGLVRYEIALERARLA